MLFVWVSLGLFWNYVIGDKHELNENNIEPLKMHECILKMKVW